METRLRQRLWAPLALAYLFFSIFISPVAALYFHMQDSFPTCFHEDLPKDTLVVGHFEARPWNEQMRNFVANQNVRVYITVEEVFDSYHRIIGQDSEPKGRFTFSAAESGEHRICFTPSNAGHGHGYMANGEETGNVRFELDMAIGETSQIESTDKDTIKSIQKRVSELNNRLHDIKREQVFQREREAEFRDQSEITNARVVRWSLIQLAVLGVTCAWQLSHLRAFFIKQKLT